MKWINNQLMYVQVIKTVPKFSSSELVSVFIPSLLSDSSLLSSVSINTKYQHVRVHYLNLWTLL